MATRTTGKRHSSINPQTRPNLRSSSIMVEGTNNHLFEKHDKTKCKHCLAQPKKVVETQKSIKIHYKLPKIERKSLKENINIVKQTPVKRASFVEKFNEGIMANRTPQPYSSPSIKEIGIDEPNLEMKKRRLPEIEVLFDAERDKKFPYHLDGDSKMFFLLEKVQLIFLLHDRYGMEFLKKREALKTDPEVQKAILDFMQLYDFTKNFGVSKYSYIQTHLKIACLLRPDLKDPSNHENLKKIIEQDWQNDSQGQKELERPLLEKALFEMADIWTLGAEKEQYVSFFNVLKMKFVLEEETHQRLFKELYQE